MIFDLFRKKKNKVNDGKNSSLETVDLTEENPNVEDVLEEIDRVLKLTQHLGETGEVERQRGCCMS